MRYGFMASVLAFLGTNFVWAGQGEIPIYQSTTITAPGHYLVTRDFSVSNGVGILIDADNVVVDLGGHTITMLLAEWCVQISHSSTDFVIRNGTIVNPSVGIGYSTIGGSTLRVQIEDVTVLNPTGFGVLIDGAESVALRGCRIHSQTSMSDSGIRVDALTNASFRGSVCDNVVVGADGYGIRLRGLANGRVIGNRVRRFSQVETGSSGIFVGVPALEPAVSGSVIQGNTVDGNGVAVGLAGIHVLYARGCLIKENTVSNVGGNGITVGSSPGTLVLDNAVQGCGQNGIWAASHALLVRGNTSRLNTGSGIYAFDAQSTLIDGNECTQNDEWGLNVNNGSGLTPYRNNLLTDNALGGANAGVDEGGNIL